MRIKGSSLLTLEEISQAKTLFAAGHSYRSIARQLQHSPHTVKRALNASAQVVAQIAEIKATLAEKFNKASERFLDAVTDQDVSKLDGYKKVLTAAIACDKSQLLHGLPTENINIAVLLQVAGELRRQERAEDEQQNCPSVRTLPAVVERVLPVPIAEPIPAPVPVQRKAEPPTPAPQEQPITRVRYVSVLPGVHEDHRPPENPLMRGLRNP